MNLSDALKSLCKRSKLSQRAFVEKAGYKGVGAISNPISRGDMQVSTLIKLADAAGYDLMLVRRVNLTGEEPIVIDSAGKYKKGE